MNQNIVLFFLTSFLVKTLAENQFLNLNGHQMPIVGIDTCFNINKLESLHMIKDAIDVGYRYIDTAYICGNEVEVGLAVEEKIASGIVKREDLFISTKLWNTYHSKSRATEGINMALKKLNVDYIDLLLMHWPMGYFEGTFDDMPKNGQGDFVASRVDFLETWNAMEESVIEGKVKLIGVANFNHKQLERLIEQAKTKPVVNLIESHPKLTQKQLIDFCHEKGVAVVAFWPLDQTHLSSEDLKHLQDIAHNHNKSVAQVMLRYQIQRGVAVIPFSMEKEGMKDYLNAFNFVLTSDEMTTINDMNSDLRVCKEEKARNHQYYPFNIPY